MEPVVLPTDFAQWDCFAGFDWAKDKHDVVVVDRQGRIVLTLEFPNTAEGWAALRTAIQPLGKVAVAIETSSGPAVERLLELGHGIYPMNPKAAQRFRDRKAPSGVKDDLLDAWSFADALRTDGQAWRALIPEDAPTQLLRLLYRDEIKLIEQRTAFVLQFQQALYEYYPAALEAFDDWTAISAWQFVLQFPTPQALVQAGKRKWEKFFHAHRLYRPQTTDQRLEIFARADAFVSPSPAVTTAKSLQAITLAKQLLTLEAQIQEYRRQIEKLFDEHPDSGLFASLPGAGKKLAPRLLGEIGARRATFASPEALQCLAGTAPVTRQSGKSRYVNFRRSCNKTLRATVHLWADLSRKHCAWAEAYYQHKRNQGQRHAQALRCLGQRWLKILWRMLQTNTSYNEAKHMLNMVRHGSWVIGKIPVPDTVTNSVNTCQ